ncbi:ferritin [Thiorhodovibrio frisius]|uniref:Ferritin n=1 Tax=Thiorhodovibrio frisius TaxID=631362 RepID=H8Z8F1_9GAMM|nr:ferritin [Thiorhodovibrio frisius]EIC19356.1 ferritin-like protein [Thiorhodovibrio frisius]WPL22345.1 Ferritin-1 [Thiorhodovibrio frisius]
MITQDLEDKFNQHINKEIYSSYLYLSMAAWADHQGLRGFSHWMRVQAMEELTHVSRFFDFLTDRDGRARLSAIAEPPQDWANATALMEDTYQHELEVSKGINELVSLCREHSDHAAGAFLDWFVKEQVEEEANVKDVLDRLRIVKGEGQGLLMIDQELGARALPSYDPTLGWIGNTR